MKKLFLAAAGAAALLWAPLPVVAQGVPANTQIAGCVASALAPTTLEGYYARLSCDLAGNLRTTGGSGGGTANPNPGSDYSTSGRQDTGNTSLGSIATSNSAIQTASGIIAQRAVTYIESTGGATTSGTPFNGAIHDLGANPAYTSMNAAIFSTNLGKVQIIGCPDSACAGTFTLGSQDITAANTYATVSARVVTRYWRAIFVPSANGAINFVSSATAN